MNEPQLSFYRSSHDASVAESEKVKKRIQNFTWYRVISFVSVFLPFFLLKEIGNWRFLISTPLLVLFFFLVKKSNSLARLKRQLETVTDITRNEIKAFTHIFNQFDPGTEFTDFQHSYERDLDIFGEGSLFQFLDRTVTLSGKNKLSGWLLYPPTQKSEISERQQAVQELSVMNNWRLNFQVQGKLCMETPENIIQFRKLAEMQLSIGNLTYLRLMLVILPVFSFLALIVSAIGFSGIFLLLAAAAQWIIIATNAKRNNQWFQFFGQKSGLLLKYINLFKLIQNQEFKSTLLSNLRDKTVSPVEVVSAMSELNKIVNRFEYRQNLLVGIVLNSFLLWDLRCLYQLAKWHSENRERIPVWMDIIAETDGLVSLANYAANHSNGVYPEIAENRFVFEAENLGHPLLNPEKRICNNFNLTGWGKTAIITGANMAGKSTFLRTVGINVVLGRLGVPVCASRMEFSPVELYTDMRTTDSLQKDESYFFAELKRIKGVIDRLLSGQKIFVILDEMLKGTNSEDKLNGSKQLIKRLMDLNAVSLIATHDLKLSELETVYPQQVVNLCFEIKIVEEEMIFDYKLYNGVTKTMNASFLLKKMGIV